METVNVRECLESVLMLLRYRIVNRVSVSAHFEAPELFTCYPGLLNQAVLNLLANALDVTPQGGTITIRTAVVQHEYRISVADSGPGIPQELRDRIFEPFFTTKPVGRGTGLGLSITDSIVRLHGGTIAVECPDGGGAVIILRLPLMAGSLTKNEA